MQPKNTPIFPVAFQHHFRAVQAGDVQGYLAQVVLPKDIQFNTDFDLSRNIFESLLSSSLGTITLVLVLNCFLIACLYSISLPDTLN